MGEGEKKKKKGKAHQFSIIERTVVCDCRNRGRVSLSPIRLDLDNEKMSKGGELAPFTSCTVQLPAAQD